VKGLQCTISNPDPVVESLPVLMNDGELVERIDSRRVFAVVKGTSAEASIRAAEAVILGGISLVEIALNSPGGLRVISDLLHRYGDRACVGAGSVMTFDQIDRAIKSGAKFISMPHTNAALIQMCRRHHIPPLIGALTPTEVATAWSFNVPIVTVYPASLMGGPEYVAGLVSRMPGIRLGAAGGVAPENIIDYFSAGAFAVSVGGSLFAPGDLNNENYVAIAERARGMLRLAGVA
jgi:2-dehydro-3-deoxyphosphogluconate aldolase / (4S)-4-hydroxy-2-oxoglutarate aldolase